MPDARPLDRRPALQRHDEPAPKTFAGPQTWAAIRESYLAGVPAPTLERRYGVKAATIWKRAHRQGWRHDSAPESPAPACQPLFNDWERRVMAREPGTTAKDAAAAADRAMREGRLDEALKLARISATMAGVAKRGV